MNTRAASNHDRPGFMPAGPPQSGLARLNRLSSQFAAEPEMILAYLEPLTPGSPELPLIWAAAEQAVQQHPDYADLRYYAAQAAFQTDQPRRARDLLGDALRLNPTYTAALILAGRICLHQNEPETALGYLERALANGADYADLHLLLGDAWQARGELHRAREAYRCALQINGAFTAARDKLAALPDPGPGGTHELPA